MHSCLHLNNEENVVCAEPRSNIKFLGHTSLLGILGTPAQAVAQVPEFLRWILGTRKSSFAKNKTDQQVQHIKWTVSNLITKQRINSQLLVLWFWTLFSEHIRSPEQRHRGGLSPREKHTTWDWTLPGRPCVSRWDKCVCVSVCCFKYRPQ